MATAWPPRRERTARRADASSLRVLALLPALLLLGCLAGCTEPSGKKGVPGELDIALFEAATELVFAERMTVGSRFEVFVVGRRTDDEERVRNASFTSNDTGVLRVLGAELEEAAEGADLVILSIPVGACGTVAEEIAPALKPGAILGT